MTVLTHRQMTDFVFYVTLLPFVLFTCKRPSSYVLTNDIVLNLRYLKKSLVAGSLLSLESKTLSSHTLLASLIFCQINALLTK